MKKILFSGLFLLLNSIFISNAASLTGGTLWYDCLNGGCHYRIYQTYYHDCSASPMNIYTPISATNPYPGPGNTIQFPTTGCNTPVFLTPNWQLYSYSEITPICPTALTACNGGTSGIAGMAEVTYYRDISLCGTCSTVPATMSSCCTSYSIFGCPASVCFLLLNLPPNNISNNSARFTSAPISYITAGQTSTFQQSAYDPDGDSLVYSLAPCLQNNTGQPILYSTGYSPTSPLGTSWGVSVNSHTGEITFSATPGVITSGTINIQVDEYRNNALICTIHRQFSVNVINTTSNSVATATISNVSGATYQPTLNKFNLAPNYPCTFDITLNDADINDILSYISTIATQIPTASLTGISNTNPITLHFSWTPSLNDAGKFFAFNLNVQDNHCPLMGVTNPAYSIEVDSNPMSAIVTPSACNQSTGAIDFTMAGGLAPYTFSWNTGATTEDLTNISAGNYWLTIFDSMGTAWYSDTFYISSVSLAATFAPIIPNCNMQDGALAVTVTGGTAPYSYSWSNGQTTASINNLGVGGYSVNIYDFLGCFLHETYLLDYLPADSCFSQIGGIVYFDANQNCMQDVLETGLPNVFVNISPGGAMLTDSSGRYSFIVTDTGTYNIQCFFNNVVPTTSTCTPIPFSKDISINSMGIDSLNNDFSVHVSPDILVSLSDASYPFLGWHYGMLSCTNMSYYNLNNATLIYQHSPYLQNLSFSLPPSTYNVNTHTATWNFSNFNVGAVQSIQIMGSTLLTPAGTSIVNYAQLLPTAGDYFPQNNQDTTIGIVTGSYDPNGKYVSPQGETVYGLISPSTQKLNYVIQFQNTGNYPAQFVTIRDTIDVNKLQINTLELDGSSHPCSVRVEEDSIVIFHFADINLPDSTSDEPHSHGFVQFNLKINPNLPINVPIANSSSIYFDFNPPVLTNSVMSTLYKNMKFNVSLNPNACPNDSVTATTQFGCPPYTFSWSNGVQTTNYTGISKLLAYSFPAGINSVQVTDSFGKSAISYFNLHFLPLANASFTYYHIGNDYGFAADSTNNTTYLWNLGNGQTSNLMNPFVNYTQSGAYNVSLIVTDDCGGADTVIQTVYVALTNIDAAFALGAKLSPNPFDATSTLRFENPENEPYELIIRDISGKIVQKIENIRAAEVKILRENKAAGTYIWELKGKREARGLMVIE